MIPALTLICIALLAALVAVHRTGAATVSRLLDQAAAERAEHRADVQTLLQRIQAPEMAAIQHAQDTVVPVLVPPLEDDDAAHVSDEVERAMQAMVAAENEAFGLVPSP